jgi:hypothetical protein
MCLRRHPSKITDRTVPHAHPIHPPSAFSGDRLCSTAVSTMNPRKAQLSPRSPQYRYEHYDPRV